MKIPISWLIEFVDIDVTPEVLAENLVRIGFEVDEIIYQEKQVKNVVTVKILSVSKHPNADRLSVCEVDAGEHGVLQVVTNAKVEAGEYVPLALDGAVLSDGTVIKKGEVRGVLSSGMFCGGAELGITDDDYEGASRNDVLRLKGEFKTGESVLKAIGYDDVILDVSVTANRPDCNSVYKLAKEVALALGKEVKAPEIDYEIKAGGKVDDVVSVSVENSELCPRYMAAAVKNVKIFPSPRLIKKRLRAVGIRPINNIVDITNYVLIEIGQPMHAFDKRELSGDKIIVRCAKENEEIVTLDGKLNKLNPSMLVICNAEKPVAVAGIMGGEESGIKDDTTEVVLESARFKRDNVRRTSRALNLKSDSSSRFEKGVDFTCQELGLKRALTLIYKTGSGDIVDGVIDKCVPYEKQKKLSFKISKLDDILGVEVNKAELVKILNTIGIKSSEENGIISCLVPADREDIEGVNDIAEEYIRVAGYDRIPATLFAYSQAIKSEWDEKLVFVNKAKKALAALGLYECVTYSFTTPKFKELLRLKEDDFRRETVKLMNPLGEQVSVMRTTLIHSMLETVALNLSRFNKEGALFEVGRVYYPREKSLPSEKEMLCVALFGDEDFFTLKGVIENLFKALGAKLEVKKKVYTHLHDGKSAAIECKGVEVGSMGELHPLVQKNYDINKKVYIAEISLEDLMPLCESKITFEEFSRYPEVERDLALVVDKDLEAGSIVSKIMNAGIPFIRSCEVFDVFESVQIGEGKKSVALRFRLVSFEKTLTDGEINSSMESILKLTEKEFGAKLRD